MEDGIKHYQRILSTLYCETVDLKDVRAKARNSMKYGHRANIDNALRIGDLTNRNVRRHAQTICHLAQTSIPGSALKLDGECLSNTFSGDAGVTTIPTFVCIYVNHADCTARLMKGCFCQQYLSFSLQSYTPRYISIPGLLLLPLRFPKIDPYFFSGTC